MTRVTSDGTTLIAQERARQIREEGWTRAHDDGHGHGELAIVAAELALSGTGVSYQGDVDADRWGLVLKHANNRVRQLTIAGALIAAEIDRLVK